MKDELFLSQSFCMGVGGLEHNLRITKGRGIRQNGLLERRHLNENLVYDETLNKENYVQELVHKVVAEKIADNLYKINEKHIRNRHPKKVRTVDDWIESQCYVRQGKPKKVIHEYLIQLGNKITGCPYEMQMDKDGNIIDVNGKPFKEWDTRKKPAYRNGKITESKRCKLIKKVYREYVRKFKEANPQAEVICASIHADENGGCHMHMNVIWFSKTKNGVGYGLSYTTAMQQQLAAKGKVFKNERADNAMTIWKKEMRLLLKTTACAYGIFKKDMHNKEKHRDTGPFCGYKDDVCDEIERRENEAKIKEAELNEKEKELSKDIAKQEWYILKKQHPDLYETIHKEFLHQKNLKPKQKPIDAMEKSL